MLDTHQDRLPPPLLLLLLQQHQPRWLMLFPNSEWVGQRVLRHSNENSRWGGEARRDGQSGPSSCGGDEYTFTSVSNVVTRGDRRETEETGG